MACTVGVMSWTDSAACRDEATSLFFPRDGEKSGDRRKREANAKIICSTCTVIDRCLAESKGEEGIWGGLTESERSGRTRRNGLDRPIVQHHAFDPSPWIAIDGEGEIQIWQRETETSWHGVEWAVVKRGEIIYLSHNLDDTYAKYGGLIWC